jgi:hypothetical protein
LHHHFVGLDPAAQAVLEKNEAGVVSYSLANVLRLRRHIVIVDEAHNARTPLSFDTLARFRPSCILEFTATPAREKAPSNVLHHVSAKQLAAEDMIKLPIRLETRTDWLDTRRRIQRRGPLEQRRLPREAPDRRTLGRAVGRGMSLHYASGEGFRRHPKTDRPVFAMTWFRLASALFAASVLKSPK